MLNWNEFEVDAFCDDMDMRNETTIAVYEEDIRKAIDRGIVEIVKSEKRCL